MNKICLIAPANLKYVPYVQYFLDILDECDCQYDIIQWNKAGIDEPVKYRMNYRVNDSNRFRMLRGYLKFGHFCRKIIKKEQYNKIIFFTIAPMFFCGANLTKRFRNRFIIDIRDASPLTKVFPKRFKKMLDRAFLISSSSMMFSSWVNKDMLMSHNVDINQLINHLNDNITFRTGDEKKIVFAGMMIEEEANLQVIKHFKDNPNISFLFVGRDNSGKQKIIDFVRENNIKNVEFEGTYNKDDIVKIYRNNADFVNIFRQESEVNRNALPNKFYDAVISGVPLLVYNHNEAIAGLTKKHNLGIVLKEEELSNLEALIKQFDYEKYIKGRMAFLNKIIEDYSTFKEHIKRFIKL